MIAVMAGIGRPPETALSVSVRHWNGFPAGRDTERLKHADSAVLGGSTVERHPKGDRHRQ